jgi:hypothetical protein
MSSLSGIATGTISAFSWQSDAVPPDLLSEGLRVFRNSRIRFLDSDPPMPQSQRGNEVALRASPRVRYRVEESEGDTALKNSLDFLPSEADILLSASRLRPAE